MPTPGGPNSSTFSAPAMKRPVASSRTSLCVDRRLELEVELLERLHRREVRDLDAHRDALLLLGVELLAEQLVEEVEIGRLACARPATGCASSARRRAPRRSSSQALLDARANESRSCGTSDDGGVVVEAAADARQRRVGVTAVVVARPARGPRSAPGRRRADAARERGGAARRPRSPSKIDDLVVADEHLDASAHEAVRHAVANRVDVDEAVGRRRAAHTALRAPAAAARAAAAAPRARRARTARAAARASCRGSRCVGLDHPAREVRLERGEARRTRGPAMRIALHVADAATRSCPWCARDTAGTRAASRPSRGRTRRTPDARARRRSRGRARRRARRRCRRAPSA